MSTIACTRLAFSVAGTPAPKGSWRAFVRGARAVLVADNRKTAPWCEAVADAAHIAAGKAGASYPAFVNLPLVVDVLFVVERPKGHIGKRGLRTAAPAFPAVKPDVDKLARATLDAMTGVVFDDDARVVSLSARKIYAVGSEGPGARITVRVA